MLDADLKARWIAALRSGEYRRATGKLYDPDSGGHCCLGVLCRSAEHPLINSALISSGGYSNMGYDPFYAVIGEGNTKALWRMNDGGKTFPEIAQYIEEHL